MIIEIRHDALSKMNHMCKRICVGSSTRLPGWMIREITEYLVDERHNLSLISKEFSQYNWSFILTTPNRLEIVREHTHPKRRILLKKGDYYGQSTICLERVQCLLDNALEDCTGLVSVNFSAETLMPMPCESCIKVLRDRVFRLCPDLTSIGIMFCPSVMRKSSSASEPPPLCQK